MRRGCFVFACAGAGPSDARLGGVDANLPAREGFHWRQDFSRSGKWSPSSNAREVMPALAAVGASYSSPGGPSRRNT
jgi:hypothetical protein